MDVAVSVGAYDNRLRREQEVEISGQPAALQRKCFVLKLATGKFEARIATAFYVFLLLPCLRKVIVGFSGSRKGRLSRPTDFGDAQRGNPCRRGRQPRLQ